MSGGNVGTGATGERFVPSAGSAYALEFPSGTAEALSKAQPVSVAARQPKRFASSGGNASFPRRSRANVFYIAPFVLLAILFLSSRMCTAAPSADDSSSPADLVNPWIGVNGAGSCMPGPCLPHSSIYPSPETRDSRPSGYVYGHDIVGFAQLHTQGTGGVPSYGNFLVSPQVGLDIPEKDHLSPRADEIVQSYAYSVRLTRYNIGCAITPSHHSALYRFTFPASTDSHILIDVARKIGGVTALQEGSVSIDPKTGTITGGGTFALNWAPGKYPLYFCARFSKTPTSHGTWTGAGATITQQDGSDSATVAAGTKSLLGAYVGFATQAGETVSMKIAVSFRSVEQARSYMEAEVPDWDFDALKAKARARWNHDLSAITLDPKTPRGEARRFYTGLWHAMVQPRDRTGDREDAPGREPFWDDHYTLWDTWKTLFPLMAIVQPDMVRDNVAAFVARHKRNGFVGTAFVEGNEYRVGQGGDEADNIIADAYVKGIPGIDWQAAYDLLKYDAEQARTPEYRTRGYVAIEDRWPFDPRMHSGSGTLGFAYNDFCVAQVARGLGKNDDALRFEERARQNWLQVWDASAQDSGFSGFIRARHADGTFAPTLPRKGYNTDFYEGTCWEYSYIPTYDVPAMVAKMGGDKRFLERLQFALQNHLIDFGNEPSFMTIWLFAAVHRPYLCSYWADGLRKIYGAEALPGDDDSGAMSSLYCFLDAGLFPFAGQDLYYLHGPRVPRLTFHLPNGKQFTVIGENASPENLYVQSATLNGKPLSDPWIHHRDIVKGGTLSFVMGPKPSAWGCNGEFDAATAAAQIAASK